MKKYFLIIAIVFLLSISASAEWITLGGERSEPPKITVLQDGPEGTTIEFRIGGYYLDSVNINGEVYSVISLPKITTFLNKGLPELPKINASIIIPNDAQMSYEIVDSEYEERDIAPVVPSKGNLYRDVDPDTVPYTFGEFYQRDTWYPETTVQLHDPFILRDFRGITVQFNPFRHNAFQHTLRICKHLVIKIFPDGPGKVNVKIRSREKISREFSPIYYNLFLNFAERKTQMIAERGNLLIITADNYYNNVLPLAEWKEKKGIPTKIVKCSAVGTTEGAVKSYIQNEYPNVTFVLLVGDAENIPTRGVPYATGTVGDASGQPADPVYCYLDGNDKYPDAFISRFSAETPSEVDNQVARSINYEKYPQLGADWYHKGSGIASNEDGGTGTKDWERCNWLRGMLLTYDYMWMNTYTEVDQIYCPGATAAQVTNALNDGRSIVNYIGHGCCVGWCTPNFQIADVNALNNVSKLPLVVSVACNVGQFPAQTCFAEAWLRAGSAASPTGAIAFYGSSIPQSWVPPTRGQYWAMDYLVSLTNDFISQENTIGGILFNGACKMIQEYDPGDEGREIFETWHIFGDASVQLRTDTPYLLNVAHPIQVPKGMTSNFPVSVLYQNSTWANNASVCLTKPDESLWEHGYTVNGSFSTTIHPTNLGLINVAVTSYNHVPYLSHAKVCDGLEDVFIRDCVNDDGRVPSWDANHNGVWETFPPDRAFWVSPDIWVDIAPFTCTPDPNPEYGEINHLYADVHNIGSQTAYNIDVKYYWADPAISITNWNLIGSKPIISLDPGKKWSDDPNWCSAGYINWWPPAPGHYCIFVTVECNTDPIVVANDAGWENNIGWKNFWIENLRKGAINYEVVTDFKFVNPDNGSHIGTLDIFLKDWPIGWTFKLTSTAELHQVDSNTYQSIIHPWEESIPITLTVTAPVCTENDTGTIHIAGTLDNNPVGGVSVQVVPPRNKLEIAQIDSVNPGDIVSLPVLMKNSEAVGAFDLYIEFDPTLLYFQGVERGSGLPEGFEYFTYRQLPCPNCGCCKYKLQVLGLYDIKNLHQGVPIPPRDYQDTLFKIVFKVANDNNLRGFKIPVKWDWDEEICKENTISDISGYILYVSDDTTQYNFNNCPIQPGTKVYPYTHFIDGGIQIATTGEMVIGDINLNGIPFDPADVTLFSSYLIYGLEVFIIDPPLQIGLTDINRDGFTLSMSDFIYMIRVILGDVSKPKPAPGEQVVTINTIKQNSHVTLTSDQPLGAALLVLDYTGEVNNLSSPFATNSNIEVSKNELRILVYMKDASGISGELLSFQAIGEVKLSKVEAVDIYGSTVKVAITSKIIPEKFDLYQNYPNPFNLETQLSFDLPVDCKVSLKIYNINGQLVRALIDKDMEAGQHRVLWDGKNQEGKEVASGIYFYRIAAGSYTKTAKMSLLK